MKKQLPTRPHILLLTLTLFMAIALSSCEKNDTEPVNAYDYYPLAVGTYQTYQVIDSTYSAGQSAPVVRTWQEKDEVSRITENTEFTTTYIVARYQRNTETDFWQKVKEYAVTKSPDKILTNLDNQTVFSMAFPLDPSLRWNGNLYNNQDERKYQYEGINQPLTIGALTFDRSLTVVERYDTSIINKYVGIKQYALGVGLVSDDQISYEYCQDDDCITKLIVESGTHRTRKLLSYGAGQ